MLHLKKFRIAQKPWVLLERILDVFDDKKKLTYFSANIALYLIQLACTDFLQLIFNVGR